ncbi:hypothetical protein [Kozakia baliensis]|uniref:hypothetical protein n=1 Tax=Kozakia baliensis TaxID=153496 RepID=UPI00116BB7D1|nr:hypothetical protein [Kozakia baliensis]GEL65707.1 hypothetical protein KBA01_29930 [Kozakia baliensis]
MGLDTTINGQRNSTLALRQPSSHDADRTTRRRAITPPPHEAAQHYQDGPVFLLKTTHPLGWFQAERVAVAEKET